MSKKVERAAHGPSWAEVILGAVLSLVLGVALGAVLLVVKPVVKVKELPKEADREKHAVYFVEGSRDSSKAKQALAKRKAFAEGQSVSLIEDELNALVAPAATPPPPPAKKGEKAAAPTASDLAAGAPNFRIRDGVLQVGVPVTLSLVGLVDAKVTVLARGSVAKTGAGYVFEPSELYLGSCPVQRLPFVAGYVQKKFLASQAMPEDIAAALRKASSVTIEGSTLKVAMQ